MKTLKNPNLIRIRKRAVNVEIKQSERIDDLEIKNYKIMRQKC